MAERPAPTEAELTLAHTEGRLIWEPCPECGETSTGLVLGLGTLRLDCLHEVTATSVTILPRTFQQVRDVACDQLAGLIADLSGEWMPASGPGAPAEAEAFARAHALLVQARRELLTVRGVPST